MTYITLVPPSENKSQKPHAGREAKRNPGQRGTKKPFKDPVTVFELGVIKTLIFTYKFFCTLIKIKKNNFQMTSSPYP